jgi:hypothetical protein
MAYTERVMKCDTITDMASRTYNIIHFFTHKTIDTLTIGRNNSSVPKKGEGIWFNDDERYVVVKVADNEIYVVEPYTNPCTIETCNYEPTGHPLCPLC